MIHIAICDDDPKAAGQIESLLCLIQNDYEIRMDNHIFLSGRELAEALSKGDYYAAG